MSNLGTKLGFFLKSSLFDFLLALVVSTSLVFTVSFGFNSAPDLRSNVLFEAVCCAILLVPLYAASWSKRALVPGAVVEVVLIVVVVFYISSLSPEPGVELFVDSQVNDVENNYAVFGYVVAVVPLLVFLLSRRLGGVVVLFFLGVLACAAIQFLYRDWLVEHPGMIAALVCYFGCGAMVVYQSYRGSARAAQLLKKPAFGGAFISAAIISIVCMVVGVAVYAGAIASLGLPTPDIKPLTDYYQKPTVEYMGVYSPETIDDPDKTSDNVNDNDEETSQDAEGGDSQDNTEEGQSAPDQAVSSLLSAFDPNNWTEQFQNLSYELPVSLKVLLAFLPVLVLIGAIVWRRSLRTRRLKRIEQRPLSERVVLLYNFAMQRFGRLGLKKPPSLTPLEFALANGNRLVPYRRNNSHVDFLNVTLIYQRAAYSASDVSEEDYRKLRDFYQAFFKNARAEVGKVRWLWKFWRI